MNKNTLCILALAGLFFSNCSNTSNGATGSNDSVQTKGESTGAAAAGNSAPQKPTLDTVQYDRLMNYVANGDTTGRWPVKGPYPLPGAVLPFKRVVAYYGNLYSNRMGALGKWPKNEMIPKLMAEVKKWNDADSVIKAVPALHYIAITAQGAPGKDGKYRYRMPYNQIDTILNWAKEIDAEVFIDVQIGLSDLLTEVKHYEEYLKKPNVHLGVDPEFAMNGKGGKRPGSVIGTLSAGEINEVGSYLAKLVQENNLPPKMYMVHRFTKGMVTDAKDIKLHPELQIIMDMDGWGPPTLKKDSYRMWIAEQPVQFTGFKLFYVNDTEMSNRTELMSREEILKLKPAPVYIQYQ